MLYIVGTPIGNVKDSSLRAVRTLANSDIILCEDTRTFDSYYRQVQKIYNLSPARKQQLIPYQKRNEFQLIPMILDHLRQGREVSMVSESGMPVISDPGHLLIAEVIKNNLKMTCIPGPSAFVNACVLSGFATNQILFLGFLPKKEAQIIKILNHLKLTVEKDINPVIVFYESPNRINKTLKIIKSVIPDAKIAIAREMTKKFEEVIIGGPEDLRQKKYKGEITVVLKISTEK